MCMTDVGLSQYVMSLTSYQYNMLTFTVFRRTWTNGSQRSVSSNIPHYWPSSATRKLDAFDLLKKSLSHAVRENRFYFPGFLVGPYIDFASYTSLIDETLFSSVKEKEAAKTSGRRVPKGRKRVAYRKMFIGLAFLGAYVTMIGTYSFESVLQPWFVEKTLVQRYFPRLFSQVKAQEGSL